MYRRKKVVKESNIESYFVRRMKAVFPTGQIHKYEIRKGEPDRLCLLPGAITVFAEIKRPGEKPRPDQERALARLRDLGFIAEWLSTKEEIDRFIVELLL